MSGRDLSVPPTHLELRVGRNTAGTRLDRFLADHLTWRSRTSIQQLIASGRVTLEGRPARKNTRLLDGDRVLVDIPEVDLASIDWDCYRTVYSDEHLLVVDKPPGVVVHPVGAHRFDTLMTALHRHHGPSLRICHRLDRNTSGLIIVARDGDIRRIVQRDFEAHRMAKQYLAIVHGDWAHGAHTCLDQALALDPGDPKGMQMMVSAAGQHAHTHLWVLRRYGQATLVRMAALTGRQHQLRVHTAAAGHPILCDDRYGAGQLTWPDGPEPTLSRHALHAWSIRFPHPVTRCPMVVRARPPADFRQALRRLHQG